MDAKKYSILMSYDDMNLVYEKLQQSDIDDKDLKRLESSFRLAQISYGNVGAFYDC